MRGNWSRRVFASSRVKSIAKGQFMAECTIRQWDVGMEGGSLKVCLWRVHLCVTGHTHECTCVWKPEDSL